MNLMRRSLIMFGTIVAIPVILVLLLLGRGIALQMMGYPVDIPPSDLAEAIASEGGDPLLCRRLQQTVPTMGPSLTEKRMLCFYLLAQKLKDPSVCELLMPSENGFSCIGTARVKEPCGFGYYANPRVQGNGIIATLEECISGPPEIRANACCAIAKVKYTDDHNDCSVLIDATRELQDQCHHELALKSRDISECSSIQNINVRSSCEIHVKYL